MVEGGAGPGPGGGGTWPVGCMEGYAGKAGGGPR